MAAMIFLSQHSISRFRASITLTIKELIKTSFLARYGKFSLVTVTSGVSTHASLAVIDLLNHSKNQKA